MVYRFLWNFGDDTYFEKTVSKRVRCTRVYVSFRVTIHNRLEYKNPLGYSVRFIFLLCFFFFFCGHLFENDHRFPNTRRIPRLHLHLVCLFFFFLMRYIIYKVGTGKPIAIFYFEGISLRENSSNRIREFRAKIKNISAVFLFCEFSTIFFLLSVRFYTWRCCISVYNTVCNISFHIYI